MTILQGQINSFGTFHEFSAPNYVIGVFYSIFSINSYLKIIFTSYLGVLFFKFLNLISIDSLFLERVEQLGYLNEDVMRVYNYSTDFYYANYLIFLLLLLIVQLFSRSNLLHAIPFFQVSCSLSSKPCNLLCPHQL